MNPREKEVTGGENKKDKSIFEYEKRRF